MDIALTQDTKPVPPEEEDEHSKILMSAAAARNHSTAADKADLIAKELQYTNRDIERESKVGGFTCSVCVSLFVKPAVVRALRAQGYRTSSREGAKLIEISWDY